MTYCVLISTELGWRKWTRLELVPTLNFYSIFMFIKNKAKSKWKNET